MTYLVTDNCIKCKHTDCVAVCPVDCFYEGEDMLVINPDECIDCGVCEPECPVDAIQADTDPGAEKWLELNKEMADVWSNITTFSDTHLRAHETRQRSRMPKSACKKYAELVEATLIG